MLHAKHQRKQFREMSSASDDVTGLGSSLLTDEKQIFQDKTNKKKSRREIQVKSTLGDGQMRKNSNASISDDDLSLSVDLSWINLVYRKLTSTSFGVNYKST